MATTHRLTDEEALAIAESDSTIWGPPRGPADELEIVAAVRLVEQAERLRDEAVLRGRAQGLPWIVIGAALGVSGEAARKKYKDSA